MAGRNLAGMVITFSAYNTKLEVPVTLLLSLFTLIAGVLLLTRGADIFVDGATHIAHHMGVGPLVVGILVVGFSTSAPEMLVALMASLDGAPALGIGNALGSNITNIGLVLGVTVLCRPLTLGSCVMQWELPILLIALVIGSVLLGVGGLSRLDGLVMLVCLVLSLTLLTRSAQTADGDDPMRSAIAKDAPKVRSALAASGRLLLGLVCLLAGSRALVFGATFMARALGVPELVIGLTVVAVGTSLPELAASIVSARKGHPELALGNIIGSNIFNALGVLAMPALVAPGLAPTETLVRDIPVTFALSVLLWGLLRGPVVHLGRPVGVLLIGCFMAYQVLLYVTT